MQKKSSPILTVEDTRFWLHAYHLPGCLRLPASLPACRATSAFESINKVNRYLSVGPGPINFARRRQREEEEKVVGKAHRRCGKNLPSCLLALCERTVLLVSERVPALTSQISVRFFFFYSILASRQYMHEVKLRLYHIFRGNEHRRGLFLAISPRPFLSFSFLRSLRHLTHKTLSDLTLLCSFSSAGVTSTA